MGIREYPDKHGFHQCSVALIADKGFSPRQATLPGNLLILPSGITSLVIA
jgi:hypothetical protein